MRGMFQRFAYLMLKEHVPRMQGAVPTRDDGSQILTFVSLSNTMRPPSMCDCAPTSSLGPWRGNRVVCGRVVGRGALAMEPQSGGLAEPHPGLGPTLVSPGASDHHPIWRSHAGILRANMLAAPWPSKQASRGSSLATPPTHPGLLGSHPWEPWQSVLSLPLSSHQK